MSKNVELTQGAGPNFGLIDVVAPSSTALALVQLERVLRRLWNSRGRFAEIPENTTRI